jgi:hypothetical protein
MGKSEIMLRIEKLSDDELLEMVQNKSDFTQEAIQYAKNTLEERGLEHLTNEIELNDEPLEIQKDNGIKEGFRMKTSRLLGIFGIGLIILGCFTPFMYVTAFGINKSNYFLNTVDAQILLLFILSFINVLKPKPISGYFTIPLTLAGFIYYIYRFTTLSFSGLPYEPEAGSIILIAGFGLMVISSFDFNLDDINFSNIEEEPDTTFNISSEIEKFYALKEKGILTEEEFDTEFEKEGGDSSEKTEPIADIPDQIKKLSDLKDQGILTEEEFQSKKKDLLDKM